MPDQAQTTQTMTITEAEATFSSLVNEVSRKETRVLIEEDGTPVAALVTAEDLRTLSRLDEKQAVRRRVVDAMRESFRDVPPEEIEQETAKAVAEVRAEMRAEREATIARR